MPWAQWCVVSSLYDIGYVGEVHNDQSLQTVVQPDDRQNEISVEMLNLNKLLFILVAKQVYKESSFSRHLPPCQANFQARASSTSEYTKVIIGLYWVSNIAELMTII